MALGYGMGGRREGRRGRKEVRSGVDERDLYCACAMNQIDGKGLN